MTYGVLQFCTVIASFIYPAYATYKELGNRVGGCSWQRFWVVNSCLSIILLNITDPFFKWIPLYEEVRFVVAMWLLPTVGNGADYVLGHYITPFMVLYQKSIDEALHILDCYIFLLIFIRYKMIKIVVFVLLSIITKGDTVVEAEAEAEAEAEQKVECIDVADKSGEDGWTDSNSWTDANGWTEADGWTDEDGWTDADGLTNADGGSDADGWTEADGWTDEDGWTNQDGWSDADGWTEAEGWTNVDGWSDVDGSTDAEDIGNRGDQAVTKY